MRSVVLPEGRYLSCAFGLSPSAGGQSRAMLMRNRILATEGGVRPDVLILGPARDHDEREAILRERGLLPEGVGLRSIYDDFRDDVGREPSPTGEIVADLEAHRFKEEFRHDGKPWRITYRRAEAPRVVHDYLRDDGSPYLRMVAVNKTRPRTWQWPITLVGQDRQVVGRFKTVGAWYRRWIRDLTATDERAFVFTDSRFVVPFLVPLRGQRFHIIYQMHNVHLAAPYRWDSGVNRVYTRVLARLHQLDAMVTLTERQRDDLAERCGGRSTMFVVPNPVDQPRPPIEAGVRNPHLVTIVARLEPQKRLEDAISAFERVVAAVPSARLQIYGEGSSRPALEQQVRRGGLTRYVTFHGFDPGAPEALWRSSAFVMSSRFEGYPLSTLESMSRGCPVVSYDIKYGPREQITDGVEGFLVPAGDVDRLAARLIELVQSPELVERLSAAARERAGAHGSTQCLTAWRDVIQATIDAKPYRTRIDDVQLAVDRLEITHARLGRVLRRRGVLNFAATLSVQGQSRRSQLDAAELRLTSIDGRTGQTTDLPLTVKRQGEEFDLSSRVHADQIAGTRLRLRLVWVNSAWETDLDPPARR